MAVAASSWPGIVSTMQRSVVADVHIPYSTSKTAARRIRPVSVVTAVEIKRSREFRKPPCILDTYQPLPQPLS